MSATVSVITNKKAFNWITSSIMILLHIGAIAALFFFSWKALIVAAILYWATIGFGIGMGYHRLLTHRSYKVPKLVEYFFAVCGTLTLEGGPIFWVATHRVHHQHSDKDGDPHTPRHGGFWAHVGWIMFGEPKHNDTKKMSKYAPDLAKGPVLRLAEPLAFRSDHGFGCHSVCWPAVFPCSSGPDALRVVLGLHATWLVNSATHMWGSRRFATKDDSRNSFWVAILTFGEGWHNNHHAHPTSARHGLAWYELDITWMHIWLLKKLGIAKNVKVAALDESLEERAA